MNTITTQIVKDGNSSAVRLPKTFLKISGLHGDVNLTAKKGQITVSQAKKARADWPLKMKKLIASDTTLVKNNEFEDWDVALLDGLDD